MLTTSVTLSCDPWILVQVAQRTQTKDVPPALPAMLGCIVDHVASLTESFQIGRSAVAGIVVEVSASENNIGYSDSGEGEAASDGDPLATVRAPTSRLRVPPAAVTKMRNALEVRPPTLLAAPPRALETDRA